VGKIVLEPLEGRFQEYGGRNSLEPLKGPFSRTESDINSFGVLKRLFQEQKYLIVTLRSVPVYVGKAIIVRLLYNFT
jgi:hypothetical protein